MSLERFCEVVASRMTAPSGITGTESIQPLTSGYAVFNMFSFHHRRCGYGTHSSIGVSEC